MLKKIVIAGIVIMAFVATSYAQMAIGFKVPFRMARGSYSNTYDVTDSEMWFGGLGTFEYGFNPVFALEASGGYLMSLGGEFEYDGETMYEYKNNVIPIALHMKFYFPMAEGSAFHPYLAGGPTFSFIMITENEKLNDDYEKTGSTNVISFGAPDFMIGFDYDMSSVMKVGGALNFAFSSTSYSPEVGDDESTSELNFGAAFTFKYCFPK